MAIMKLTKQTPFGPFFDSYSVAVCMCNSGAENDGVERKAFRVGHVPKFPAMMLCGPSRNAPQGLRQSAISPTPRQSNRESARLNFPSLTLLADTISS